MTDTVLKDDRQRLSDDLHQAAFALLSIRALARHILVNDNDGPMPAAELEGIIALAEKGGALIDGQLREYLAEGGAVGNWDAWRNARTL